MFKKLNKGKKALRAGADNSIDEMGETAGKNVEQSAQSTPVVDEVATKASDERIAELEPIIRAGKELKARARDNEKMTTEELEKIYQAKQAKIEVTEMTDSERALQLAELDDTFEVVRELTDGIPRPSVSYSDELTTQINAVINKTDMADELQQFVQAGNLQEVLWQLDEAGLHKEAVEFENILTEELKNTMWLHNRGVDGIKHEYGPNTFTYFNYDNNNMNRIDVELTHNKDSPLWAYKLDKLLGTKAVPTVVERNRSYKRLKVKLISHRDYMDAEAADFIDKYKSYLNFIDAEQPSPLTEENLQQIQLLRYVTGFETGETYTPIRGRALALDVGVEISSPAGINIRVLDGKDEIDVSKLNFVGPDFIKRLKEIKIDDVREALNFVKDGHVLDDLIDVPYHRLLKYIEAAEAAAVAAQ